MPFLVLPLSPETLLLMMLAMLLKMFAAVDMMAVLPRLVMFPVLIKMPLLTLEMLSVVTVKVAAKDFFVLVLVVLVLIVVKAGDKLDPSMEVIHHLLVVVVGKEATEVILEDVGQDHDVLLLLPRLLSVLATLVVLLVPVGPLWVLGAVSEMLAVELLRLGLSRALIDSGRVELEGI